MGVKKQYCTFYMDKQMVGVPVEQVQEVIRYQEMTRVPLVPDVVRGLINLRGQIVAAVDLRRRLGLKVRRDGELPTNVVIRTNEGVVSLLVDEIGDVLEVEEDSFEAPPETLREEVRGLVQGVHQLKGNLLLVLNSERALTFAENGAGQTK
jgi:purine-binding chemotaxis protein CheW